MYHLINGCDTTKSEGPQNGSKTTGMDITKFREINGPAPMPKNGAIGQIVTWGVDPPPPVSLWLRYS